MVINPQAAGCAKFPHRRAFDSSTQSRGNTPQSDLRRPIAFDQPMKSKSAADFTGSPSSSRGSYWKIAVRSYIFLN